MQTTFKSKSIADSKNATAAIPVIFILADLPDMGTLLAGLPKEVELHLLDPNEDGLKQVAAQLDGRYGIPALHLITHGRPGELHFGAGRFTRADFSVYEAELHAIANAMAEDGELLIYGCEVASGRTGRQFIDVLTEPEQVKIVVA